MAKNEKTEQIDLFSDNESRSSSEDRVKELEYIIETLDTLYHGDEGEECIHPITGEVVLDNEYDEFKKELFKLNPNSKIFKTVHAAREKLTDKKVIHNPPMTSINKCNGTEKEKQELLTKWFEECRKMDFDIAGQKYYPAWLSKFFCMSYKHDGIALSIEYEDGKLVKAGLRSKSGMDGTDVTDKMKYIKNVLMKLPIPITCKLRGELETPVSVFNKINPTLDEPKKNPRAYTAGSMGLKDPEDMKGRGVQFTCYNVIMDNPPYNTEIDRAKWVNNKLGIKYITLIPFDLNMLRAMEKNHKEIDFMVDGVVISVNDLSLQKNMGTTGDKKTGNPKGKLAYKFADEIKQAVVKEIVWQTGRTGSITPVLIFDGIQLEGTTVSKCTAHNWGIIKTNKIGIGSIIEIIKSGKIIPKLKKVVKSCGRVSPPMKCPSCGGKVEEVEGNAGALSLVCRNDLCSAQDVKKFNHYLSVIGVKGLAESTLTKLLDLGLLKDISDLYRLTPETLMQNGFTPRTASLIFARIQMVPNPEEIKDTNELTKKAYSYAWPNHSVPLDTFIASFGMEGAGKEVGRLLSKKYKDFGVIRKLTAEELESVDGIGAITASSIVSFFKDHKNEIDKLLHFVTPVVVENSGKFDGKNFVLSGSLDGGKKKWESFIKDNGGTLKSSVGKNVDYLVAGEGSGSKSDKAKELHIKIIDIKQLESMV